MSKTLIAIVSCHTRQHYTDVQRETWIPRIPTGLHYRVFRGRGATRGPLPDEVFLDCEDGYSGLPEKVRSIARWAVEREYDFMLKCDDDVLLLPEKFLTSGFDLHDFVGNIIGDGGQVVVPWGFCWTISRQAMQIVSELPLPSDNNDELWVAYALRDKCIHLHSDERYRIHKVGDEELAAPLTRPDGQPLSMIRTKRAGRPLRAPERHMLVPEYIPGVFAYCMFYTQGERLPDDRNIAEMRKIWARIK
jgi:hypothetical protein